MAILETIFAGSVLAAFLQVLFDRLSSPEFIHFIQGNESVYELTKKLKLVLLSVNSLVNDAEEKQLTDAAVGEWLSELEEAIRDAEDLVDEINTRAWESKTSQVPESTLHDFFKGTKRKIEKMLGRLDFMVRQKEILALNEGVQSRPSRGSPPPALEDRSVVYGRDADENVILDALQSDDVLGKNISVISIVGMGGIGKTTLAQIIYHKVRKDFHLPAWISVCGDFNVFRLTKSIFEAVTFQESHFNDLYQLQVQLEIVVRGRKIFFVLDDVWNEDYVLWNALKTPFQSAAPGSRIIITTRNENIASMMSNGWIHKLKKISDEASWLLFSKHAIDNVDRWSSYPDLEKIGQQIVEKCKGLPLAIKSLGGLLRSELDTKKWMKILNTDIWELSPKERNILPALWLSYYHLPPYLKRCFAYCSIFPKSYKIEKAQLVLLWMADDLLQFEKGRRLEDVGEEYIHALISRSLFQHSTSNQSFVNMHDLVHDLATFISRGSSQRLHDKDSDVILSCKTRHLSFMNKNIYAYEGIKKFEQVVQTKNNCLRVFLSLKQTKIDRNKSRNNLVFPNIPTAQRLRVIALPSYTIVELPHKFENLKHLRYFDLSRAKVEKLPDAIGSLCNLQTLLLAYCLYLIGLPDSVGNLKRLRYLDLSFSGVRKLPNSVCDLYNLQTLLLENCKKLTHLPTKLGNLSSLRHLNIERTNLKGMPPEMGKMKDLHVLTDFILGKHTGSESTIKDLGELQHLQGELTISGLENFVDDGDVSRDSLKNKNLGKLLLKWQFCNRDSPDGNGILEKLEPHTNLKEVSIELYHGEGFPSWVGHSSFSQMIEVSLIDCKNCLILPPLGQLPSLRSLEIRGFDKLEIIGAEFYGDGQVINPFKSLKMLYFENMLKWRNWSLIGANEEDDAFPCLEQLCLVECPKMNVQLPDRLKRLCQQPW